MENCKSYLAKCRITFVMAGIPSVVETINEVYKTNKGNWYRKEPNGTFLPIKEDQIDLNI